MSFSLRSLTDPDLLDKAVQLAARQLGEPAFPDAVWQRERQRLAAALKEANTRPGTVAGRAFAAAVYGSHPYGYEMTAGHAGAHQRGRHAGRATRACIAPCRAKVSIVGAVTRAQADALVTSLLSRLPATACAARRCQPVPEVPPLARRPGACASRSIRRRPMC